MYSAHLGELYPHLLLEEREPLHLPESIRRHTLLRENYPRLPCHMQIPVQKGKIFTRNFAASNRAKTRYRGHGITRIGVVFHVQLATRRIGKYTRLIPSLHTRTLQYTQSRRTYSSNDSSREKTFALAVRQQTPKCLLLQYM